MWGLSCALQDVCQYPQPPSTTCQEHPPPVVAAKKKSPAIIRCPPAPKSAPGGALGSDQPGSPRTKGTFSWLVPTPPSFKINQRIEGWDSPLGCGPSSPPDTLWERCKGCGGGGSQASSPGPRTGKSQGYLVSVGLSVSLHVFGSLCLSISLCHSVRSEVLLLMLEVAPPFSCMAGAHPDTHPVTASPRRRPRPTEAHFPHSPSTTWPPSRADLSKHCALVSARTSCSPETHKVSRPGVGGR